MRNTYLQQCDYGSRFRILKGGKISLVVSAFIVSTTLLQAGPIGGVVTAGSASIVQSGLVTNITQSTNKASINWNNFSIANNEIVNFNQPNVNAVTLNRVVGNEKSIIDGALNANGQVFILNSNGVLFSKNASINTAGLVATTMNLSDTDFINGNYNFKGNSSASIINQGTITISDKGYAALFGKEVINEGIIKATLGKVELVGAKEVTLNLNGNSLVSLHVNKGVLDALVENKGAIYADGGEVYLTTNAVNELLKGVVNNTGVIEAQTLNDITGKIELYAHGGALHVSGTLDASAPNGGDGGFIETSGTTLGVAEGTVVTTKSINGKSGTWLIDPYNMSIVSTINSYYANESILASTLETGLASGDIIVQARNAVFVNAPVSWNTHKLTLDASYIYIYDTLAASNTASLEFTNLPTFNLMQGNGAVLNNVRGVINFSGTGSLIMDGKTYIIINTQADLQGMAVGDSRNTSAYYALGNDLALSGNFTPIGDPAGAGDVFFGSFNGLGHVISGLRIIAPGIDNVGLFSQVEGLHNVFNNSISNLAITGASIVGDSNTGVLAGRAGLDMDNIYVAGSVTGTVNVGGLIGYIDRDDVSNAVSGVYVTGIENVGGLIGYAEGIVISTSNSGSSVIGDNSVSTATNIGGLVGYSYGVSIRNSSSNASIALMNDNAGFLSTNIGDLVGYMSDGDIDSSFAMGHITVDGASEVGGLVGFVNSTSGSGITKSVANVTIVVTDVNNRGSEDVGGFVGCVNQGDISQSFSSSDVTADNSGYVGGFVGFNVGTITDAYAQGRVSGYDSIGGFVGGNDGGIINRAYSTGVVMSSNMHASIGGFAGYGNAGITNSFYDKSVNSSASLDNGHGIGKTTTELKMLSTYSAWIDSNSDTVINDEYDNGLAWRIYDGKSLPLLTAFLQQVTSNGVHFVYWDGSVDSSVDVTIGDAVHISSLQYGVIGKMGYDIELDTSIGSSTGGGSTGGETPKPTQPTQDPTPIITQIINGTSITPPVIPNFTPPTPPAQTPQQFNAGGARVQLASVPSGDTPSQLVGTQEARAMIQGGEVGDLRIPLGQNSGIQLVNGGVHLPEGLEQQFFMAQR